MSGIFDTLLLVRLYMQMEKYTPNDAQEIHNMFCVWGLFQNEANYLKKLMLQGYNESRLKSSFRKLYGRYNDLVCDYKLDWQLHYMTNVMILTLQSSTFPFYVVTYHFHLLMVCTSPSWFDTQEHVLRMRTFQNEANYLQKSWCCKVIMILV
jgi:hypothetical protein